METQQLTQSVPEDAELEAVQVDDDHDAFTKPLASSVESVTSLKGPNGKTKPKPNFVKTKSEIHLAKNRSALPSMAAACKFEWHNLNVFVGNDKNRKQILYDFNGTVNSGELLAVMGGSGAGKSTLLNALSGRTNLNEQYVEGELAVNSEKFQVKEQQIIKALCTYVPQSDILCPTQTVEEALQFYARLKLPDVAPEKRQKRINYLIDVLHLGKCRNNFIGDEKKRGISGGEKRRVSIAAEILNEADIIFLDEPTSGLDAYTAARTIKTLKQFCNVSNKIIIATIHQPSVEVFYLFDKLILLSAGKCCFNSWVEDIDDFFKDELRPKTNPADVIVFGVQRKSDQYVQKWKESRLNLFDNEALKLQSQQKWENYSEITMEMVKNDELEIANNTKKAPMRLQFQLLLKRELQSLYRDKRLTVIRLLQVLFFAFAAGLIYFQVKESFAERVRCFFLLSLMPLLFGMVSLLTVFPKQKLLFTRENNSGAYGTSVWTVSFMIIEIPREIIHMLIFTVISYFLIGLSGNFISYWITLFLTSFAGGSFGILFGTICKTTVEAAQLVPAALIPLLIFSDGLIPLENLHISIRWIAGIDPLYYLMRCFYIIEFDGAVYPQTFGEDQEEICGTYSQYLNGTYTSLIGNLTSPNCSTIVNSILDIYNITDYVGYNGGSSNKNDSNYMIMNMSTTIPLATETNDISTTTITITDITTTLSEEQAQLEEYCQTEISADYFFERYNLNPNALTRYLLTVLALCFVIRFLARGLLFVISNDGFSWFTNQIRQRCGCKKESERKESIHSAISFSSAEQVELKQVNNGNGHTVKEEETPFEA